MLTSCFKRQTTQVAYQASPAGPYLDDFTRWLHQQGYRQDTIRSRLPGADQFVAWAQSEGIPVSELTPTILTQFHAHLSEHGQLFYPSGRHTARCVGAQSFLVFAQSEGLTAAPAGAAQRSRNSLLY